ncbi:MAG: ABC transporter permease [Candidatus Latescibacterota bacterium]
MGESEGMSARAFARGVRIVLARELGACFDSPIAYVYAAAFLALAGAVFMNSFFLRGVADMGPYFEVLPYLLIAFAPALTMRIWAEERSQHTFELLMTLPFHPGQVVLGKYGALLGFYAAVLLGSLPVVAMLAWLGEPDWGVILASYLGALLLGAFFLALGQLVSALTRDQVVAFVLGVLLGFGFVLSGHDRVVEVMDGLAPAWQAGTWLCESVSVLPHYQAFGRGVVRLADLLYFGLLGAFFLAMNPLVLRRARQ